jgi:protein-S-isoprenylcysteine O-methyltransferase Ste14
VFILGYLLGVLVELFRPSFVPSPLASRAGVAGGTLFVMGAILAGWGLYLFHREQTTTVPGRVSARLVIWGPYRMTRNPMYVGLTLAYLGEAALQRQLWPLLFLPLVLLYVNGAVIPLEEARLHETFGSEYEAYRARVRRWL